MIYVTKFRANDLNPSKGKQIEFNIGVIKKLFQFESDQEIAEFKCHSVVDSSFDRTIKASFSKSPARGDYKIYQNADGSQDLKDYFLNVLHLTKDNNQDDYYAIRKTSPGKYLLYYIPKNFVFSSFYGILSDDQMVIIDSSCDNTIRIGKAQQPAQTIYYGCPGSGKSHEVNVIAEGEHKEKLIWYKKATDTDKSCPRILNPTPEEQKSLTNNVFRTTFHPDYDHATFVGCYKPVKDNGTLDYKFVPQVFTNAYVCALRHPDDPIYLIIEEINRGNCAQIFGDLFQLLDRKNGVSEYPIKPDTELAKYLAGEEVPSEELSLPANLNIYATMNTSDQSLFPMDSAFKRRWQMVYKPIEYTNKKAAGFKIHMGNETYPWIGFLKMVNERILDATDSEDKQMGEFFIKGDDKGNISEDNFKNKVMFYIWNDVCKDHYTARRPNGKFFMKLATPQEGEKEYFTFVDLFDNERNNDSRLLKEFILFLEKKYLEDHTSAPLIDGTNRIDWVKHLSLPAPDDSGNE